MTIARDIVVHGLVQGVFFRGTCMQVARSLEVAGWVRNEYDGTVRLHAEGSEDAVEALITWCREGPKHASVTKVDVTEAPVEGLTNFDVGW
ncbi:MAG: acylphosphatase [Nocardioides sp.]|uniref:acylphosphatase n=1 Tax=Nocardioides sp. TaxID=35761 RepID=UPI0039E5F91D